MRGKLHQFMTLRAVYIIKLEMDFFLLGGGGGVATEARIPGEAKVKKIIWALPTLPPFF